MPRQKARAYFDGGINIPYPATPNPGDILEAVNSSGDCAWNPPVFPEIGCNCSGTYVAAGTGAFVLPPAGTAGRSNPAGQVANGRDCTIPPGWTGRWRLSLWIQYQNAAANNQGAARFRRNGATFGTANGIVRLANAGIAGAILAGEGSVEADLTAGDVIAPEVMHTDTTSRTLQWAMTLTWIG